MLILQSLASLFWGMMFWCRRCIWTYNLTRFTEMPKNQVVILLRGFHSNGIEGTDRYILHHLGCIKPCKSWDKLPTSTGDRRTSSINSIIRKHVFRIFLSPAPICSEDIPSQFERGGSWWGLAGWRMFVQSVSRIWIQQIHMTCLMKRLWIGGPESELFCTFTWSLVGYRETKQKDELQSCFQCLKQWYGRTEPWNIPSIALVITTIPQTCFWYQFCGSTSEVKELEQQLRCFIYSIYTIQFSISHLGHTSISSLTTTSLQDHQRLFEVDSFRAAAWIFGTDETSTPF